MEMLKNFLLVLVEKKLLRIGRVKLISPIILDLNLLMGKKCVVPPKSNVHLMYSKKCVLASVCVSCLKLIVFGYNHYTTITLGT